MVWPTRPMASARSATVASPSSTSLTVTFTACSTPVAVPSAPVEVATTVRATCEPVSASRFTPVPE